MDTEFVSGAWVCRRFNLSHHTLRTIRETVGHEVIGWHRIPGTQRHRYFRHKVEGVIRGQEGEKK